MSAATRREPRHVLPGSDGATRRATPARGAVVTPARGAYTERDTYSLALACISWARRDSAAAGVPALRVAEAVGGSQRDGSRIGLPPSALRAAVALDSPYRITRDANRPPRPVMHCPLGSLRSPRSYAHASRDALSAALTPESLRGYLPAPVRSLTARLRAAGDPLDLDRPDPDRPPGPDPLLLDLARAQLVAALTHWSHR